MEKEFAIAPFPKRLGAWFLDFVIIFLIWYTITINDLKMVDELLETLNPDLEGSALIFSEAVFKLYTKFILKWFFVNVGYYTLIPAIIGRGKTLGKLLFGISMVKRIDLKEASPTRLILREAVGRGLIEILLIIPTIVSIFMLFTKEQTSIHDRISKTIVIQDSSFIEE